MILNRSSCVPPEINVSALIISFADSIPEKSDKNLS